MPRQVIRQTSLLLAVIMFVASLSTPFTAAKTDPSQTTRQEKRPAHPAPAYPSLQWRFETESQITDTPLLAGDTLLVHSEDGFLYALDQVTGKQRWRVETGHARFARAEFAVASQTVYVADTTGHLRAVNIASGEELWRRNAARSEENQVFSAPTVVDGVVYVDDIKGDFGNVYALATATGDTIWQAQVGRMPAYALPVVDDAVIVTDIDGKVWFLDAKTGDHLSTFDAGAPVGMLPAVADGIAYIGVAPGQIDAIEIQTAEAKWSVALPVEQASDYPPSIWGFSGGLLIASYEDRLIGVNSEEGEIQWEFKTANSRSPEIDDGTIYSLDADSRLTALEGASGKTRWASVHSVNPLVKADDGLVYASSGQSVYALNRETGKALWRVRTGGLVDAPVLVSGKNLYIGSADHSMYAVGLDLGTGITDGFVDVPALPQDNRLFSVRLETLPEAPAFAGVWRAELDAGAKGTLPAFAGPTTAVVQGGSLSSPDGLQVGLGPEGTIEAPTVEAGQNLFLPIMAELSIENPGNAPVELLIVGILPERPDFSSSERRETHLEQLGGAIIELLPGPGAFVELRRTTLDPGAALLPVLSVWPDLLVVEAGSVDFISADQNEVTTYDSPDGIAAGVGITRFVRAGDSDPATLLILEIDGDIHIGQGAGCGGRCLNPR